ncbi:MULTISPECIES: hypothetical protein [Streptomyces]|uniref:Uncharacterized protein n=1 Tax=Streptomyces halstedii TaxID=1944 RepID=A0A6N9U919_STRHA|nr:MULTISPECIES: hypothetical protein [Streptomyces]AWL41484.1 hypothetical protein B9S64_27920 [Streptomyces sp. SM18]MBV7671985.1 hypothetical protein [Streptomyces halstedii]NEA20098.1 hypothetical protein [Streptomyces halstedii]
MVLTPRLSTHSAPVSPTQPTHPAVVEANEAIRALVDERAGQDWSSVESAKYEILLIEWAAATRGTGSGMTEAA